jgi:tetratricopeptide (TPR) repeat protein
MINNAPGHTQTNDDNMDDSHNHSVNLPARPNRLATLLSDYRIAIQKLTMQKSPCHPKEVLHALVLRDEIAQALIESELVPPQEAFELVELDQTLQDMATVLDTKVGSSQLAQWRATFQPTPNAWWWSLDEKAALSEQRRNAFWLIVTGLALALSLTLAGDICNRFLSGGPDALGIVSTAGQVLLTVLAGSAFTEAGRKWIGDIFSYVGLRRKWQPMLSSVLALVVLSAILGLRCSLGRIGQRYYLEGVDQMVNNHDVARAMAGFQRTISLDPDNASAHYNLAYLYESVQDYDKAIAGYQRVISINDRYDAAYNNVARLYMLKSSDYSRALELVSQVFLERKAPLPLEFDQKDAYTRYSALKNRGWAFLGLGHYELAKKDLQNVLKLADKMNKDARRKALRGSQSRSVGAEAHSILAQVLEKQKDNKGALTHWRECLKVQSGEIVAAQWLALAVERVEEAEKIDKADQS